MNRLLLPSALLLTCIAGLTATRVFVGAADVIPEDMCRNRVHHELERVLDQYRAHLFGSKKATEGSSYIPRTGGTVDEEFQGIFETRGRLTSELVDPLVESYRVLRCQAHAVCDTMQLSFLRSPTNPLANLTIEQLGCEDIPTTSYSECIFGGENIEESQPQPTVTGLLRECDALVQETLVMEQAALRLAVGYDSGYRSMLQFAGMTDQLLQNLPDKALPTMTQTVNLLGKLHQIPCFIGQCDAPNTSALNP